MKIAIASGKGGTGKTLVSTNLFYSVQKAGIPVTLVDCDAEEPNDSEFITGELAETIPVTQNIPVIDTEKCTFCGKCHEYCNYHAIVFLKPTKFIQVVEELCHDCGACTVACEYGAIIEKTKELGTVRSFFINTHAELIEGCSMVGVYSPVPVIKAAFKKVNGTELVIVDAPPGTSCPFIATVEPADFVILVTEPTPFGLNDLKISVETLEHLGKKSGVIINRAGLGDKAVNTYLREKNIPLLMEIPFERKIAGLYSEGKLIAREIPEYKTSFFGLYKKIQGNYLQS